MRAHYVLAVALALQGLAGVGCGRRVAPTAAPTHGETAQDAVPATAPEAVPGPVLELVLEPALEPVTESLVDDVPKQLSPPAPTPAPPSDLADLRARYALAGAKLKSLGYSDPDRIAEVIAPRFIQYSDWDPKKTQSEVAYDPWLVYCPAPTAWQSWEFGNTLVVSMAAEEREQEHPSPLTVSWLQKIWESAMKGLENPGFRKHEAMGPQWTRSWALDERQIEAIRQFPREGLLGWTGIKCFEDLDEKVRAEYENNPFHPALNLTVFPKTTKLFKDASGVRRQCGFIEYAPAARIESELQRLTQDWAGLASTMLENPFYVASFFQRRIVAIHPYRNGNGRLSRFVMDRIVMAAGLPAPLLADMNLDLYTTDEGWANAVRDGVVRAIFELERCAAKPSALGCQEVRKTQPKIIPEGVCKTEF